MLRGTRWGSGSVRGDGRWAMDAGRWIMGDGRWTMDKVFMQKSNAKPANVEIKPAGLPRVTRGRKESSNIIGKFKNIQDLINAMEDSRLEEMCEYIKEQEKRENN